MTTICLLQTDPKKDFYNNAKYASQILCIYLPTNLHITVNNFSVLPTGTEIIFTTKTKNIIKSRSKCVLAT